MKLQSKGFEQVTGREPSTASRAEAANRKLVHSADPAWSAAFIGVVTTVSAALVAHLEAGRYQFIAATYRVTAKRLENTLGRFDPDADNLQQFVEKCETIMGEENNAWMAKHVRA